MPHQGLEIDDLVPETWPIEYHRNRAFQLAGLSQRQDFGELIQRAEAAGKYHQCARQVREPELAHEEVTKLERQCAGHVDIRTLFMRQADIEPDGSTAGVRGSAVGGLHDSAAAAGTDNVAMRMR